MVADNQCCHAFIGADFPVNDLLLALPLSPELVGMLKRLFRKKGPAFDTTNFRKEWNKACVKVGLGRKTGKEWYKYEGPVPSDFRRSAVRNLINAGVDQATAMKITGHRTVHLFQRYNSILTAQLHETMAKLSNNAKATHFKVVRSRRLQ